MNLTGTIGYHFGKVVFSKSDEFSAMEVVTDLAKQGFSISESEARFRLKNFRDYGLVMQHGTTYSLESL